MSRRVLLAVLVLAALPAPPASAAALKLRDAGAVGADVYGDGARYIASGTRLASDPVTLVDTRTGARSAIPTPAGCALADMHHGVVLWNCKAESARENGSTAVTYDVTAARRATLPLVSSVNAESASYLRLGDAWALAHISAYHGGADVYVDRATGRTHESFNPSRDVLVDLDLPSLTRRLCRGQRRGLEPDDEAATFTLGPGALATAGERAATVTYYPDEAHLAPTTRLELQRCGHAPTTLASCRSDDCSQPVIDGRLVAWAQSRSGRDGSLRSRLVVRSLRSGRERASLWTAAATQPLLVGPRLYAVQNGRLLRAAL